MCNANWLYLFFDRLWFLQERYEKEHKLTSYGTSPFAKTLEFVGPTCQCIKRVEHLDMFLHDEFAGNVVRLICSLYCNYSFIFSLICCCTYIYIPVLAQTYFLCKSVKMHTWLCLFFWFAKVQWLHFVLFSVNRFLMQVRYAFVPKYMRVVW
jgi:hypothetical protein